MMSSARVCTLLVVALFLAAGPTGLSGDGLLVSHEIAIFPAGWDSEEQIQNALSGINTDLIRLRRTGDSLEVLAPFGGSLRRRGEYYSLRGSKLEIEYPRVPDSTAQDKETVNEGDTIIRYNIAEEASFLFLLRNSDSPIPRLQFEGGQLKIYSYSDEHQGVYAISSGEVVIFPAPTGIRRPGRVSIFETVGDDLVEFFYLDVQDITVATDSIVKRGTRIGTMMRQTAFLGVSASIRNEKEGKKELSPMIVYIEVDNKP
jgi:hypothetical protein